MRLLIVRCAGLLDERQVIDRPLVHGAKRHLQRSSEFGYGVFDRDGRSGNDVAGYQAIAFHAAQCLNDRKILLY